MFFPLVTLCRCFCNLNDDSLRLIYLYIHLLNMPCINQSSSFVKKKSEKCYLLVIICPTTKREKTLWCGVVVNYPPRPHYWGVESLGSRKVNKGDAARRCSQGNFILCKCEYASRIWAEVVLTLLLGHLLSVSLEVYVWVCVCVCVRAPLHTHA